MDINESMNIQTALEILDISLNDIQISELTSEYIKKRFYKMALKYHPDKNKNTDTTNKFQKINEAYEYLIKNACINESETYDNLKTNNPFVSSSLFKDQNNYINLLVPFITSIIGGNYKDGLIHIIKAIVLNYDVISVKLFEGLDKYNAIELYSILETYKHILHISDDNLELVSSIIKEKYKNDKVFILNPNIEDLFDNKIYKLYVDDKLYLVPLWHNELYFDGDDGSEIIVLCQPKLPENIIIDENNNIHIELIIELTKVIIGCNYSFKLGVNEFNIPYEKLYIKKEQIYFLKNQGISKILENDIYNVSSKADIIVKITLI